MAELAATDDRRKILVAQLDAVWELLDARLCERRPFASEAGSRPMTLTDEEYFWEPVAGCWSLRASGEEVAEGTPGTGTWSLDGGSSPPEPPPFTTIAWRLCHLARGVLLRYDYTYGSHSLTANNIEWPQSAMAGVAFLREHHTRWRDEIAGMPAEELDQIGRSQYPWGLDRQVRFIDLVSWTNVEFAHHAAEIACLRDLFRYRNGWTGSSA